MTPIHLAPGGEQLSGHHNDSHGREAPGEGVDALYTPQG